MDSWSVEKKREYMSELARRKWGSMSDDERKKFGKFLAGTRKKIIV